jgi:hypothetical protein
MSRSADGLLVRLPYSVGRLSPTLGRILTEEPRIRAFGWAALLTLPMAMATGLLLGGRDSATYASSLLTVAILAAIAGFGTTLGFSAWLLRRSASRRAATRRRRHRSRSGALSVHAHR